MSSPYNAYALASHTVSKTRQVVMLYEGAIRFLQQAKEAIEHNEPQIRFEKLTRASDIVLALQSALDMSGDSAVGEHLYQFYASLDAQIISLHTAPDPARCDAIVLELRHLRDAWDAIDRNKA